MKQQKTLYGTRKKTLTFITSNLQKLVTENNRLQVHLLEATDKKHQEMSRAIELRDVNQILKEQLHKARNDACKLRELNWKLKKNI